MYVRRGLPKLHQCQATQSLEPHPGPACLVLVILAEFSRSQIWWQEAWQMAACAGYSVGSSRPALHPSSPSRSSGDYPHWMCPWLPCCLVRVHQWGHPPEMGGPEERALVPLASSLPGHGLAAGGVSRLYDLYSQQVPCSEGTTFGLMLCCHRLEILNFIFECVLFVKSGMCTEEIHTLCDCHFWLLYLHMAFPMLRDHRIPVHA